MTYTHNFHIIRKRTHVLKISLVLTYFIFVLVLYVGFTFVDAERFFGGFMVSLLRVTIAYFISLGLALAGALVLSHSKRVENLLLPILDVLQSFPSFALFPLLLVWLGRNSSVTIVILVISMIWPILFTLHTAQTQIRSDLKEAALIYGASGFKYYTKVLFPLIQPALITGSIVAWGEAWETIIAAEIIVNVTGVGTYLADVAGTGNTQVLVVGILLLLMILFLINKYIWLSLLNLSTRFQQD